LIEFKNINLAFPDIELYKNLNLKIDRGEKVCISGDSGTGKSTLLKLLQGYVIADEGEIYIDNILLDHHNIKSIRDRIVWIPQNVNLPVNNGFELMDLMHIMENKDIVLELMGNFLFLFLMITSMIFAQNRPVNTYSIVAYDEETGQLGVAVQSHWFAVGQLVPWVKAGVGAVATQSFVKVDYGPDGLTLMEKGMTAQEALDKLTSEDSGEAVRQVAFVDFDGNVATHTGSKCVAAAGHHQGKHYSVQANMMEHETVWPAMAKAFESTDGDLADKMMASLEAAQSEGGDIRGKQSAAMIIASGKPSGTPWKDIVLDLRVDDHSEPLKQLKRLIKINRAYNHANKGDFYMEEGKIKEALHEYDAAAKYYPENPELPYWTAITLAGNGEVDKAIEILKDVFKRNPKLQKMTPRLVKSGLLPDDEELLKKIMSIKVK